MHRTPTGSISPPGETPHPRSHSHTAPDPDTECNIIYSSGTTGVPKGIVHSHGCRMHWATDLAIALRYHSGAVTLCSLGLYSNISWVAMLVTTLVGGTLVVMPSFTPPGLLEQIERHRVTHGGLRPGAVPAPAGTAGPGSREPRFPAGHHVLRLAAGPWR